MSKKTSVLAYTILAALAIWGAWLIGLFEGEHPPTDVSRTELLLSLFGLFLLVGASIGIVLVFRQSWQRISRDELAIWEVVRKNGKRSYIQKAVVRGCVFGLIALSIDALIEYHGKSLDRETVIIFVSLFLVIVGGIYYGAVRNWTSYEDVLSRSKSQTDHQAQEISK